MVCFIATSLDGFIAGPRGEIDWLFHDADYGFTPFMRSVDTVILGRKTWETALKFEKRPFAGKAVFVFSRKRRSSGMEGVTFVAGAGGELLRKLRKSRGRGIWLVGGGDLARAFFDGRLVDRLVLTIHPVALGAGRPLFDGIRRRAWWTLKRCRSFPSGLIQVTYDSSKRE